ncbi:MAG: tetratricopeptide repeat protein [Gammaproteobacteria bacterium]
MIQMACDWLPRQTYGTAHRNAVLRVMVVLLTISVVGCSGSPRQHQQLSDDTLAVDFGKIKGDAEQAYKDGDWAVAVKHYQTLVRETPQDAVYWFRLGNAYARTKQPDRAISAYREALVRDADNAKAWFNMGVVQLRQAANSFLKMEIHVDESDPYAAQGKAAYDTIMDLLGVKSDSAQVAAQQPDVQESSAAAASAVSGERKAAPTRPAARNAEAIPFALDPAAEAVPITPTQVTGPAASQETESSESSEPLEGQLTGDQSLADTADIKAETATDAQPPIKVRAETETGTTQQGVAADTDVPDNDTMASRAESPEAEPLAPQSPAAQPENTVQPEPALPIPDESKAEADKGHVVYYPEQ